MDQYTAREITAQTDALREIRDAVRDLAQATWMVAAIQSMTARGWGDSTAGEFVDEARDLRRLFQVEAANASAE